MMMMTMMMINNDVLGLNMILTLNICTGLPESLYLHCFQSPLIFSFDAASVKP